MSVVVVDRPLEDAEWEARRSTVQKLYISEDLSLKAVMKAMADSHDFHASKSQYERHFRLWQLRKNLKSHEWKAVDHHVSKRKFSGKDSDLYVDGILIPNKKVRKETSRNNFTSTFDRIAQAPSPKVPEGLVICTPSASGIEMLPMQSLPWYRFADFLDATGEAEFVGSHGPYLWQKILCQSAQNATSTGLDVGSLGNAAMRDLSQGLVLDASIQASRDDLQDSRFQMMTAFLNARGEQSADNVPFAVLNWLSVLPEATGNEIGSTKQSSEMQILKLFMFLLSNNHVNHTFKSPSGTGSDEIILGMVKARNGRQYKHLLSHGGPTSEALSEKVFQIALKARDVEACRIALDCGIDPNNQGYLDGRKPLQWASYVGNFAITSMLINAGADVNCSLHGSRNLDMTNLLLAKGANADTIYGEAALRQAACRGDFPVFRSLILAGVDVNWRDDYGCTALHLTNGKSKMVKILLEAGADVDAITDAGLTVLDHVVQGGCTDTIRSVLDAGLENFGSAVYHAVEREDIDILRVLLNGGAGVDACFQNSRRTALTRAVEMKNIRIVRFLLESGANANGCTLKHSGLEHSDSLAGKKSQIESIEEKKDQTAEAVTCVWEHCHWRNYTPLQAASFHQEIEIARMLIEAGAIVSMDFRAGTLDPRSLLDDSVSDAESETDEDDKEISGFYGTAVQIAAHQGNMALVQLFCQAGADINSPAYGWGGRTALQAAVERGDYGMIDFLLAAGADVNAAAAEVDGTTALAAAIMCQDPDILNSILNANVNFEDTSARHSGVTALAAATAIRDVGLVRFLLLAGADPFDSAALHAAVANDDMDLIRILLVARSNSNGHQDGNYGCLALYQAVKDGRHELVELLLASRIDPSVQMSGADFMGYEPKTRRWIYDIYCYKGTPWLVAVKTRNLRLIRIFLEAGADPNQLHVDLGTEEQYNTALGYAASHGEADIVLLLLEAGADSNVPANGHFKRTALQVAVENGREKVIDILLKAGADLNAPPSSYGGVTALQAAAIKGYLRIARVLIEAGADVNAAAAKREGRTALAGAAEHGRIDMLQYLLENGASIHGAGQAQYESAIHYAAQNGHQSASNLLKSHQRRLYGSS